MRRVFFSFHYKRDILRIGQIRNAWVVRGKRDAQPFLDKAEWESIKLRGDKAIQDWIDTQMKGTSVTVVLIGAKTHTRPWVEYEIQQSHVLGKGMLGIDMSGMKDLNGNVDTQAVNPFSKFSFTNSEGMKVTYPVYKWLNDSDGDNRDKFSQWVEQAARAAGR